VLDCTTSPQISLSYYQAGAALAALKQAAHTYALQIHLRPDLEGIHPWVEAQPELLTSSVLCPSAEAVGKAANESR